MSKTCDRIELMNDKRCQLSCFTSKSLYTSVWVFIDWLIFLTNQIMRMLTLTPLYLIGTFVPGEWKIDHLVPGGRLHRLALLKRVEFAARRLMTSKRQWWIQLRMNLILGRVPHCKTTLSHISAWFVRLVWFYGISTIFGYLKPNPV